MRSSVLTLGFAPVWPCLALAFKSIDEGVAGGRSSRPAWLYRRLLEQHLLGAHVFELAVVAAVADQLGIVDAA